MTAGNSLAKFTDVLAEGETSTTWTQVDEKAATPPPEALAAQAPKVVQPEAVLPKGVDPKAPVEKKGPLDFRMSVARQGADLGVSLRPKAGGLCVVMISERFGQDQAETTPAGHKLQVHDFITEINGQTAAEEMVKEARTAQKLALKVHRPRTFIAKLTKSVGKLGSSLMPCQTGADSTAYFLEVTRIQEGALDDYNKSAAAELQVMPQDHILSVNGQSGDCNKMIEKLRDSTHLELKVLRPPAAK